MFIFKVEHRCGFKECRTLESALLEYARRTKRGHKAFVRVIWKPV